MALDEEDKKTLEWLTDRVWRGDDNLHSRVGSMEKTFRDNFLMVEYPKMQDSVVKLREMLDKFKERMTGNGEKGYVEKMVDSRLDELKSNFGQMIEQAINKAMDEREKKTRDKWDARSWAVLLIVLGLAIEKLWEVFGP